MEASLMTALPTSILKKPADRGSFDAMVDCQGAKKAADTKVKQSEPDLKAAKKIQQEAENRLENYKTKNWSSFETLRDRTSSKEVDAGEASSEEAEIPEDRLHLLQRSVSYRSLLRSNSAKMKSNLSLWGAVFITMRGFILLAMELMMCRAVEEGKWGWIDIDTSNVDQVIQEGPILVKFFAPWCSHCKAMAKDFHKLAQEELPDGIRVGRVDSTKNPALNKRFGIHGYPTLLMLTDEGKEMRSYNGDRSFSSLLEFAKGGWRESPLHDPTKPRPKKSFSDQVQSLPWTVKAVGLLFVVGLPLSIFAACYDVYVEKKRRDEKRAERKAAAGKAD
eukprot:s5485_g2.t1